VFVGAPVVVGGFYTSPYALYDPWFGYDFQGPWGYPYGYRFAVDASLRIEVKPSNAEVYVDGYYAGIVDDYDGTFQRLRVMPGQHEIEVYLDGFRTFRQRLYLEPNNTFKLKANLEPLPAGEAAEPRPQPINPIPQQQAGPMPGPPMRGGAGPTGRRLPPPGPPQEPPPGRPPGPGMPMPGGPTREGPGPTYGTVAIHVQPADVEILIDGEAWRSPDMQERLVIDVAEGPHTIEIRKSGYRTYVTQVQVRRGETTPINVSLRTQEE
jgi:hypothetical protein